MTVKISDEAKALRNEYMRAWRKENKEQVQQTQANYWERKAAKLKQEQQSK